MFGFQIVSVHVILLAWIREERGIFFMKEHNKKKYYLPVSDSSNLKALRVWQPKANVSSFLPITSLSVNT